MKIAKISGYTDTVNFRKGILRFFRMDSGLLFNDLLTS